MAEKQRIEYIDLAKGICICLVVWNHISWGIDSVKTPFYYMVMAFRMPLYFFLSGLFFKTYGGFLNFFLRKTNKLLVPFLSFHFLTAFVWMVVTDIIGRRFSWESCLYHFEVFLYAPLNEGFPNQAIWFLFCLFIMNVLFYICVCISLRIEKSTAMLVLITFVIGFIGYWIGDKGVNIPFYLDSAMTALPFFAIGFCIRKYTDLLEPNQWDKYNVLFAFGFAMIAFLMAQGSTLYYINRYENNIAKLYISGFCGLMAILLFSKQIKHLPVISYLGRYSIIILVTHFFVFPYVQRGVDSLSLPIIPTMLISFVLTMFSYMVIIPLFIKFLPHITAQKDLINVSK